MPQRQVMLTMRAHAARVAPCRARAGMMRVLIPFSGLLAA